MHLDRFFGHSQIVIAISFFWLATFSKQQWQVITVIHEYAMKCYENVSATYYNLLLNTILKVTQSPDRK